MKEKQQGHGGWNPSMEKVIRKHEIEDFHIVDSLLVIFYLMFMIL